MPFKEINDNGAVHYDYGDGYHSWWLNGERHREDGPAWISLNVQEWWYHGKYIPCKTQQEFEAYMRLKAFW